MQQQWQLNPHKLPFTKKNEITHKMNKMLAHLFFLFSFFIAMATISASITPLTAPEDEIEIEIDALQSLKKSLIDPLHFLKDWRFPPSSSHHCNWTGILCNSNGRIQTLNLANMNLSGSIPHEIHHLTSLTSLNLSSNYLESSLPTSLSNLTSLISIDVSLNNFVGPFPSGIGNFKSLIYLNASSNNFVGSLPLDLGSAIALETLDFRGSFFEGPIPTSFKSLQSLKFLGLSGNNLTGRLPLYLGQLSSLETMILGYNEFEGPIPAEIGNLSKLQYLDLAVGSLSGGIPVELANLKNLTTVYLYKNAFSGGIPKEIGNVSSLIYLDLSDNQISGEIPKELGGLKNLQLLNLMCNQLTGSIPIELGDLPNLEILELWKNSLVGSLPLDLGKNSPLQWLDVSSNKLSGEIPAGMCDSGELTKLILFNNSFSGSIPLGLSNCSSLVRVRVQNNLISGTIPPGFGTLPKLQRLELENNNLTGEIPDEFALSSSLSFLDLSKNNLHSSLPSGILSIPTLQTFMASKNMIIGHVPNQFQDCPFLSVLDLSHNNVSGEIPESISSCEKLVNLNLRGNRLTGEIPRSIATMPTLSILDLSNNSLTGEIPKKFGSSPALETLNLSFNKLQGPVPTTGMFTTINPSDLEGNLGLCGGVLPPCSHDGVKPSRTRRSHIKHILIGFLVGISITLGIGLTLLTGRMVYIRWYLYSSSVQEWFKKNNKEWPWRLVAFQRLNFTSTNILACVKESNVIGMGGSGIVYKAEIQRPHNVVAVKKLWRSSNRGDEDEEDLFGEVNLLGRLRHRNIVRLLGYLHNETDVMMVYEFVPNGNLWSALHVQEAGQGAVLVDWVSRYNVAVGVAQGLAYLHHDCHPPVIHRDIKSNNILLDANFEAKIADFGLAKTMHQKNKTISMVAGSYGYIAPEYGYTMKVDEKSDIYSFGVVLLELITGKIPLDPSFGESVDIVEWVRSKIRGNKGLEETLDLSVAGQCKHVQEEMLLALRIAILCTAKLPKDRPSARDILVMLQEAKPRRKSVCDKESNSYKVNIVEKTVFGSTTSPATDLV